MKRFLCILTVSLLLIATGCAKKVEIPENVLQKEVMVDFLIDAYIAESKTKNLRLPHDSARVIFRHYELALYNRHNITEEAFERSYQFYLEHPKLFEEINATVLDSLGVRERLTQTD